ncbi:MAG TPA: methyltransferase domain-containing protein [Acidimicrobiales bacterium]|nr:methyltransferase domain-containing protein [Acidimicrobiales bacterium]
MTPAPRPRGAPAAGGSWDPAQYNRFAAQREQPFWDLRALLEDAPAPRLADLGCGDGRLTAALHRRLGAAATIGVDSSPAMLAEAAAHAGHGLAFVEGDIASFDDTVAPGSLDVVFSNAALQWVPDHRGVLGRWRRTLAPAGQLAVQMPSNADHASHRLSRHLGEEWLGAAAPADPVDAHVLAPEAYAQMLHDLGFARQHVRLQVYGHLLSSPAEVVEWVKGTSLTRFQAAMGAEDFGRFVEEYRRRLVAELGAQGPYFYAFKRILLWGRLPARDS